LVWLYEEIKKFPQTKANRSLNLCEGYQEKKKGAGGEGREFRFIKRNTYTMSWRLCFCTSWSGREQKRKYQNTTRNTIPTAFPT